MRKAPKYTGYSVSKAGLAYSFTVNEDYYHLEANNGKKYSIHIIAKNPKLGLEALMKAFELYVETIKNETQR